VIALILDLNCSVFCWAQSQPKQQSQSPLDLDYNDQNSIIIINDDNNNGCYDDLYLSDENGDGKVDSEEFVEFSRRRLQYSLMEYEHEVENELELNLSDYGSFSQLPSVLQQNWFVLACLCSRYQFGNGDGNESNRNKSCCVGDNAHLRVTTAGSTEELMYVNLVCDFTQRAIDEIITNMIIEEIGVPPDDDENNEQTDGNNNVNSDDEDDIGKIEVPSSSPSVATTTANKDITNLPTTPFPTKSPIFSPTLNLMTTVPTIEPTALLAIISTGSRPSLETTTSPTITPISSPSSPLFFGLSIGIIVAIVAGAVLLVMILIQATVLVTTRDYRRRRNYSTDPDNEQQSNKRNTSASTDDHDDEDEETGLPNALLSSSTWKKEMTHDDACTTTTPSTVNTGSIVEDQTLSLSIMPSNLGKQKEIEPNQQQMMKDQQGGNNSVHNSIPYVHAGSTIIPDDAKSTGCVSHESDAGWSEAYTSSMGSVSDNDDEMIPNHHHPGGFVSAKIADTDINRSFSEGPVPSTTDEGDGIKLRLSSTTNVMINTENTATKMMMTTPDETITTTTTPQSIVILEGASENDEIIIHEDISDEGSGDDGNDSNSNNDLKSNTRSPEEFRSEVYTLIERVIPEEIDQADDMIAQFTDREDELLQTLLAMEIRASAQQKDRSSSAAV